MRIEPLLEGGNRLGCIDYVFFYEVRNGRRIIGKNKIKEIFFCRMNARDVFILWLLCVLCLDMPLTCVEIFVCVQGFSRQCP